MATMNSHTLKFIKYVFLLANVDTQNRSFCEIRSGRKWKHLGHLKMPICDDKFYWFEFQTNKMHSRR